MFKLKQYRDIRKNMMLAGYTVYSKLGNEFGFTTGKICVDDDGKRFRIEVQWPDTMVSWPYFDGLKKLNGYQYQIQ